MMLYNFSLQEYNTLCLTLILQCLLKYLNLFRRKLWKSVQF